jgi:flagellar basal-body rod protein FlgB
MMERILGSLSLQVIYKGLEGTRARHEAIADNLANVSTPGYKRKVVRFEEKLAEALDRGKFFLRGSDAIHRGAVELSQVRPEIELDTVSNLRADGNTVDIDREAAELAMNTGRFLAMVEVLNREYRMLHRAIREEIR